MSALHDAPRIPDLKLLRLVGSGSYGDVWLARTVTGAFRAVKVVWKDRFADLRPYEREFEGITRFAEISLREPLQLALLHTGRDDAAGFFYYVMELADDRQHGRDIVPETYAPLTLRDHARQRGGALPMGETITLGVHLSRGLKSLHAAALVHRDVKPSNVILVGGVPKLADVGLVAAASAQLTFVGTEGYVPPEGPGAPAADVYSLGKVLYELATGLDRNDFPRLPDGLAERADRREFLELNEVLLRACEPDPRRRFSDGGALLDELLLLQAGKSVRRLRRAERRIARALRLAAVCAGVAAVAGVGAFIERQRANEERELRAAVEAERDALARRQAYAGNLASAQRALAVEDYRRARRLLQEAGREEPGLRGFEWGALWREAQGDPREVLRSEGPAILRLELSPDESLLAVGDNAGVITLYDVASRQPLRRLELGGQMAGFSGDGDWLLGLDRDSRLCRLAVADGEAEKGMVLPEARAVGPFGAHGMLALTELPHLTLSVVEMAEGNPVQKVELVRNTEGDVPWRVYRAVSDATGKRLAVACVRGNGSRAEFLLVETTLSEGIVRRQALGSVRPSAVGVDHIGGWAVIDMSGEVWRPEAGGWTRTEEKMPPGTRRVVGTEGAEGRVQVSAHFGRVAWTDTSPGRNAGRIGRGHNGLINDLAASSRHNVVFSADAQGALFAWDLAGDGIERRRVAGWDFNAGAAQVVFSADSTAFWLPLDGTTCGLLDATTLGRRATASGMVYPIALTGSTLLGVSTASELIRVNPVDGQVKDRLALPRGPARIAALSADGCSIAALDHEGVLWNLNASSPAMIREGLALFYWMAFDATGRRLWLVDSAGPSLLCLRWPEGTLLWQEKLAAIAPHFLALPRQELVVVALVNGSLEIRESETGRIRRRIDSGSTAPQALAASPDGRRLFAAGIEGNIHCFDTTTWEEVHALPLEAGVRPHQLTCSPDGGTLAVLTKTGVLHMIRTTAPPK